MTSRWVESAAQLGATNRWNCWNAWAVFGRDLEIRHIDYCGHDCGGSSALKAWGDQVSVRIFLQEDSHWIPQNRACDIFVYLGTILVFFYLEERLLWRMGFQVERGRAWRRTIVLYCRPAFCALINYWNRSTCAKRNFAHLINYWNRRWVRKKLQVRKNKLRKNN